MVAPSSSGAEAARRNERELSDAIEIIPAMVFIALPGMSNVFANRSWREYTGLSAQETSGSGWKAVIHPEDLERHVNKWEVSSTTGAPFEDEARFRRASDGQYRWFLTRAVPLRDEQGSIIRWYGVLTDIEDRKQAENAVRRSEAYLAEAQRLTQTASWARDYATYRLRYWSEEMFRIFEIDPALGLPANELFWERIHPEDRALLREQTQTALRKKSDIVFAHRLLMPDGRVKHLQGIGHPSFTDAGDVLEFVGTTIDVTERKRAEESLALTSFALNNVREAAYLIDENSSFHYVNEETCRALGYTREELRGMCVPDVNPDFPVERWPDEWARRKSKRSLIFESRHRAKDGRIFPVEINSNYFEHGGQGYIVGLARDITERKRAEEATLEARVSERTRIARELHDTLLQSFHGLLLRLQTASLMLPERPMEAKERLDSAIDQATEAITEGRDAVQALRESTVQRNDLARALTTLAEELAKDTTNQIPVGFHVSVEGEPRNLHPIVRDEIYKISAEAMRNAFRHAGAKQVAIVIRYDDEQVRLRVRDDGKGIDPEVLSRKASEGHYGIAGMRERATILGGKLGLWSELGAGTEIELCVPASKDLRDSLKELSPQGASSQTDEDPDRCAGLIKLALKES
jgi:PAS domain S-box-containing protein